MRVGFIGIGNVGVTIARDLAGSEHELTVYDARDEAVAEFRGGRTRVASSPAEVAAHADVVGICVRTDAQVLDALGGENGVYSQSSPGLVVAIHCTIHLDTFRRIVEEAGKHGVRIVDAPVSRGSDAPKTKATVFILGGAPDDVEAVARYVEPAALAVVRSGEAGSALILKICNNALTYLNLMAQDDVFRLASGYGVDLARFGELVAANGAGSQNLLYAISRKTGGALAFNHAIAPAEASAAVAEKDLSAAMAAAAAVQVEVPAISHARENIRPVMFRL